MSDDLDTSKWYTETCTEGYQLSLRMDRVHYQANDGAQDIVVFDNPELGRVMALDGALQISSGDEFIYHEMMAHPPIFAHGNARDILIIGGGDGGVLREVLRHTTIKHAVLVEIDPDVVSQCKQWMPEISKGAFEDPRTELIIHDGAALVRDSERLFDVIIIDSTDPVGPGRVLFEPEFYANCRKRLRDGGILVCQAGTPLVDGQSLKLASTGLRKCFSEVSAYLITNATYTGGPMALGWASDNANTRKDSLAEIQQRFTQAGIKTRCYTPEVHKAAFALPPYIAEHLS